MSVSHSKALSKLASQKMAWIQSFYGSNRMDCDENPSLFASILVFLLLSSAPRSATAPPEVQIN